MAKLFGELAYNAVHKISAEHGFKEGSAEKNVLHALIGGIMSQLTSGNFLAGASGAMINEMIQQKLAESFKDDPAMHQWASALVGTVVSQIVSGKGQAGASAAVSGTKNNILWEHIPEFRESLKEVDVSNLPEGYCRIVSYGGGKGISASDSAIIFNTPDNEVFSSVGVTLGASMSSPINLEVGLGWLEDPNGNIITESSTIIEQMVDRSSGGAVSVVGGKSVYTNDKGYKFVVQFITPGFGFSGGISYTKYLGKKEDVAKGIFK